MAFADITRSKQRQPLPVWCVLFAAVLVSGTVTMTVFLLGSYNLLHVTRCKAVVAEPLLLAVNPSSSNDTAYKNLTEHPACIFLRSHSRHPSEDEHHWGGERLCITDTARRWLQRSSANCYSCVYPQQNVCIKTPTMMYHQYLEKLHPDMPEANLLSLQSFLLTQDLTKAKMVVWVPILQDVYAKRSYWLFDELADYISIKVFNYTQEVKGTIWERDPFFGNATLVKSMMPNTGSYSDVVRMLILHKYGGFWMDNDVILYQDVSHLLLTSYQFVMRWMNLHIMRMHAGSPLTHRMMQLATTMPLNHPTFLQEVVEKVCKPVGYYQIVAARYGYTDIYNGCLHRLLLKYNNTGTPDAVLYDLPLGWWDHDWIGCFRSRESLSDTDWERVSTSYLAMHNRYPSDPKLGPNSSPLGRVIKIIHAFFDECSHVHCLPLSGRPIIAYQGIKEKFQHHRLL